MIDNIPKNCVDIFVERFKIFPSICLVEPPYDPENFIEKALTKYHKLWEVKKINSEGILTYCDILLEYDPTGIMFYIKDNDIIFILSKNDKSNIVDFTIHNLKKK